MPRLCEGRVCIVTGAGRGIGREHAKLLAEHGAKLVVNDLGGNTDGTGKDPSAAEQVVAEIRAAGGEAVVDGLKVGRELLQAMEAHARGIGVQVLRLETGFRRRGAFPPYRPDPLSLFMEKWLD